VIIFFPRDSKAPRQYVAHDPLGDRPEADERDPPAKQAAVEPP